MKNLKSGRDIGEKWAYNFSDLFYMILMLNFPAMLGNQQRLYLFFIALLTVMHHFEKVHNENAAYGI